MRPNRIAVDWDGTLAYEVWPGIGGWLPGALDALRTLSEIYDEVVIFTLRVAPVEVDEETPRDPEDQYLAIERMLHEADLPDNVWVWGRPYKPPCQFFIDDRNIAFNGDWDAALAEVAVRRVTANHQEETVEEAPIWIDQDAQQCCSGKGTCSPSPYDVGRTEDKHEGVMREFETGATRDTDEGKLDFEGFLSPRVLETFAQYMHKNRVQSDGSLRASDNWQKGIPLDAYMKSGWRHFFEWWASHRAGIDDQVMIDALCALMFNTMGYLHELVKADLEDGAAS